MGLAGCVGKGRRARADTWERVRRAVEDRTMGRREAEEERHRAATLVQQAWSGGYKRACEVGGAVFVPMALTLYGGWHREDKDSAESWTRSSRKAARQQQQQQQPAASCHRKDLFNHGEY